MKRSYRPKARIDGLIVEELDDEILVYDLSSNRAHCLNSTAKFVWQHCDGRRTADEIARRLHGHVCKLTRQNDSSKAEDLVWLALDEFRKNHLLENEGLNRPQTRKALHISRREALWRVGVGAAIAVPVVVSITAPTAVQAGTCKPHNASCTQNSDCCSFLCTAGHCA